jgi:lipoprotein-anchoring transpeptidase ErfK/SrfK
VLPIFDEVVDFTLVQLLSCMGNLGVTDGWYRQPLWNGWENALAKSVGSQPATPARFRPAASSVRRTLLASVALACVTGASLTSLQVPAAATMPGFSPYLSPYLYYDPYDRPNPILRPRPVVRPEPELKSGLKPDLKPEPAKDFGAMPKGPLQIVVSIADQHVTLYSNGVRVAQGPVSTGVPGRPTPTGVFSIIQKDRFHHSNLYSNAPMPFMERITWSGVALHEGPLPGYPASHGCIRMTHDFALRLWQVAKLGVRVIVARSEVLPVDVAHPGLFQPKPKPPEPPVAGDDPDKHALSSASVNFAQATTSSLDTASDQTAGKPMAATDPAAAAPVAVDALRGAVEMGRPAAPGITARVPAPAAAAAGEPVGVATKPALADPSKPAPDAVDPVKATPMPTPLKARTADQPVRHTGTVAVFISRKEKKLFVRQGMEPLFDMPVEIEHPEQPFGTHVFTALGFADSGARMRWNLMSIAAEPRQLTSAKIGPKVAPGSRAPETYLPQTAAQVLDRIHIPQEASDRIGEILSPGASLVISDQGLGEETGEGTDFIVLTR